MSWEWNYHGPGQGSSTTEGQGSSRKGIRHKGWGRTIPWRGERPASGGGCIGMISWRPKQLHGFYALSHWMNQTHESSSMHYIHDMESPDSDVVTFLYWFVDVLQAPVTNNRYWCLPFEPGMQPFTSAAAASYPTAAWLSRKTLSTRRMMVHPLLEQERKWGLKEWLSQRGLVCASSDFQ